jgi:hypothetical protein
MKPIEASGRRSTDDNKPTQSVTDAECHADAKDAIFCEGDPQDVTEHDAGKPTPSVATPPQDGIFGTEELRDAIGQHFKPTPSVATSPKDAIFTAGEPLYHIGHGAGKRTPSFAMSLKDAIFTTGDQGLPLDKKL